MVAQGGAVHGDVYLRLCVCLYSMHVRAPPKAVASHSECRSLDNDDELHFGVHNQMLYARNVPAIEGAQWTGIITQVRAEKLVNMSPSAGYNTPLFPITDRHRDAAVRSSGGCRLCSGGRERQVT